ncbi:DUF6083 domain-containing protein [Streptomyces sp. NPDC001089]
MRPHPLPADRHWDGNPRSVHRRRGLQIAPTSPSRLLRAGQSGRCRHCGNSIDWCPRHDDRPIALHPVEVAVVDTPASCRWHIDGGIAHPHDDGSAWCRIPHAALCPRQPPRSHAGHTRLTVLRRELAVHSRRLIDTGAFTLQPQPHSHASAAETAGEAGHPTLPVVRILLVSYLGHSPLEDIRCVAQTRQRRRCTHPSSRAATWQAAGDSCPPGLTTANSPCRTPRWPSTTSATCPTPTNCAGAPNTAPPTPPEPPPISPSLAGRSSTLSCTRRTSAPACRTPRHPGWGAGDRAARPGNRADTASHDGHVLLNIAFPPATYTALERDARHAGQTPERHIHAAIHRALAEHTAQETDRLKQSADADALVHTTLVPLLRRCRTTDDVAAALGSLAERDGGSPGDAVTLGLRGNNAHQIRYLLARATAYVEEGCQRSHDVLAYLDRDRFHIEHLYANHHHRVAGEIPDAVLFRSRRNQLGGLGLLMGRENSSLNDMPLSEKSQFYPRSNVLLGIIGPGYDRRNPILREFIKTHQLDRFLRSFGPQETMTSVVQARQELYLRLFEHIWSPERLGLPAGTPGEQPPSDEPAAAQEQPTAVRRRPTTGRRRTDVAKMIDAQILKPGTQIVLTHRATDHWATIGENGGIVLNATGGTPYGRVDEAGAVARGTKTCQGMIEWHIEEADGTRISLRTLRDRSSASRIR